VFFAPFVHPKLPLAETLPAFNVAHAVRRHLNAGAATAIDTFFRFF
jgi:hypothetical protein